MTARILIIEDNYASLELAEYLLNASGHETFGARDGAEGVRTARRQRPDLIVCDLQMPIMNGYEVVRELKNDASLALVPVIAVTALSMPGDRDQVMSSGFQGYLTKPIDPESFVQTIEGFLPPEMRTGAFPHGS